MKRTIIFGDIHGCIREWKRLLRKLKVTDQDRLICVGDLIAKGPSSSKVLDLAMSLPNLTCILGNHELRFLLCWKAGKKPDIKSHDRATVREMGRRFKTYMKWISRCPLYVQGPNWIVVHAGLKPRVALKKQTRIDLATLRTLGIEEKPWYHFYHGRKTVVFGHWVRRKPLVRKNVIGLDTGCVYGGRLSALILPSRKIVSVKAAMVYRKRREAWD
ncbi:MAG: hypothetical protein EXS63_03100 [Candidatus Omnitrophica bacterium]|nr:hypothetical protein [Candidatus Omnitrophota bacterium]